MARKSGSTILQEELYPPSAEPVREEMDDARLADLDVAEESPFLRGQKRVSARRSSIPKKTANRLLWTSVAVAIAGALTIIAAGLYEYGQHSWRFRVDSSDNIEVTGTQNVTKAQIMEVMGVDIGRNIFFIPLAEQKTQLEQIPWVESASVMRFVPNRLKVEIHERTPVAFARVGAKISLIDAAGTLMELPRNHKYSFPVILGMNPGEPISTRAPRMKAYNELVENLDSGGARYSQDLSEVDLSDLENLKVRVNDPAGDVLVELGSSDYLYRYKIYVSHVQDWRHQFQKLESVNLRYDNQVIVNPDMEGRAKPAAPAVATPAKMAAAVGIKPAAIKSTISKPTPTSIPKTGPHGQALPNPVFELSPSTLHPNPAAAKKPAAKVNPKKAVARTAGARVGKSGAAKRAAAKGNGKKPAATTSHAWSKPAAKPASKKPVQSVSSKAASGSIPKPSAAIAKQQASPSPN
jgi:cell division protein FtsQ